MMKRATEAPVVRIAAGRADSTTSDLVAVERPLEISVRFEEPAELRRICLTMRTPGDDGALAVGFLHAEGVLADARAVRGVEQAGDDAVIVDIHADFRTAAEGALGSAARQFVTTGACGVCGRTSIAELSTASGGRAREAGATATAWPRVAAELVHDLPARLRAAQEVFAQTGGLHAAALFTADGTLQALFEDVGRHNAVDKLVGMQLLQGRLPASDAILVVSGRASFELVQKAAVAGIPVMVAVGAPSSLAIEIAAGADMTLVGFARDRSFNVYTGAGRIAGDAADMGQTVSAAE
jgi:FdhD protein